MSSSSTDLNLHKEQHDESSTSLSSSSSGSGELSTTDAEHGSTTSSSYALFPLVLALCTAILSTYTVN